MTRNVYQRKLCLSAADVAALSSLKEIRANQKEAKCQPQESFIIDECANGWLMCSNPTGKANLLCCCSSLIVIISSESLQLNEERWKDTRKVRNAAERARA